MKSLAYRFIALVLTLIATIVFTTGTASAQNDGNVSVGGGIDFVSDYYFRGIIQETEGFIAQPWLEAGFAFSDSVSIAFGTWNSLHSVKEEGATTPGWYESDFYAGLSFGVNSWSSDVTYTRYMSPRGSWGSVNEVAIGVGYDMLVSPYATIAFEMDSGGGADGGLNDGAYIEVGIEPGVPFDTDIVAISIPVALGLSLTDYYESGTTDSSFGFFSAGAAISIPLSSVPAEYGSWELAGSVNLLVFGDGLQAINDNDSSSNVSAVFGLSFGY